MEVRHYIDPENENETWELAKVETGFFPFMLSWWCGLQATSASVPGAYDVAPHQLPTQATVIGRAKPGQGAGNKRSASERTYVRMLQLASFC
jgi:hypothetical protein